MPFSNVRLNFSASAIANSETLDSAHQASLLWGWRWRSLVFQSVVRHHVRHGDIRQIVSVLIADLLCVAATTRHWRGVSFILVSGAATAQALNKRLLSAQALLGRGQRAVLLFCVSSGRGSFQESGSAKAPRSLTVDWVGLLGGIK